MSQICSVHKPPVGVNEIIIESCYSFGFHSRSPFLNDDWRWIGRCKMINYPNWKTCDAVVFVHSSSCLLTKLRLPPSACCCLLLKNNIYPRVSSRDEYLPNTATSCQPGEGDKAKKKGKNNNIPLAMWLPEER